MSGIALFMREVQRKPEKVAECAVINLAAISLAIGLIAFMGQSGLIKMSSSAISGLTFAAISGLSLSFILYNCVYCKEKMGKDRERFDNLVHKLQPRERPRQGLNRGSSLEHDAASREEPLDVADMSLVDLYGPPLFAVPSQNAGVSRLPLSTGPTNSRLPRTTSFRPSDLRVGAAPRDDRGFPLLSSARAIPISQAGVHSDSSALSDDDVPSEVAPGGSPNGPRKINRNRRKKEQQRQYS